MHRDQIKAFPGNVDLHLEALAVLRGTPSLFDVISMQTLPMFGGSTSTTYRVTPRPWPAALVAAGQFASGVIEAMVYLSPVALLWLFSWPLLPFAVPWVLTGVAVSMMILGCAIMLLQRKSHREASDVDSDRRS